MTDRWLSVEEIAEYLGVSKDTVYAWIAKRNMPAHRIGRLWKFKSEEVDGWVPNLQAIHRLVLYPLQKVPRGQLLWNRSV